MIRILSPSRSSIKIHLYKYSSADKKIGSQTSEIQNGSTKIYYRSLVQIQVNCFAYFLWALFCGTVVKLIIVGLETTTTKKTTAGCKQVLDLLIKRFQHEMLLNYC